MDTFNSVVSENTELSSLNQIEQQVLSVFRTQCGCIYILHKKERTISMHQPTSTWKSRQILNENRRVASQVRKAGLKFLK